jgi:LysM repeat protein
MSKKFIVAAGALVGASLLATQQAQASTYTVKSGDTISSIAKKKYNTHSLDAIETIVQANNISDRNFILVGDKLELPDTVKKIKESKVTYQTPTQPQNVGTYTQTPTQTTQQQNVASQDIASTTTSPSYTGVSDLHSYVTSRMASATGVDAGTWEKIISRESNWNQSVTNSSGHYGLFQLAPGYEGNGGSIDQQIQGAISLFEKQGLSAWSETAY